MENKILGLHHITAIAASAQRNYDFYTRVLGLRLVKKTVNFDDPGTYHFYFGNETGAPGTILTFFPWEDPDGLLLNLIVPNERQQKAMDHGRSKRRCCRKRISQHCADRSK